MKYGKLWELYRKCYSFKFSTNFEEKDSQGFEMNNTH